MIQGSSSAVQHRYKITRAAVRTRNTILTIASNKEVRSSEWSGAQYPVAVDYGKSVERIGEPRAQKRSPPPVAGTGARACRCFAP